MTDTERKARLAAFKDMSLSDLRDCATEMYRLLRECDADLDAHRIRAAQASEPCEWRQIDRDLFKTSCVPGGGYLHLAPKKAAGWRFCPHCGKRLVEVPYSDSSEAASKDD